MRKLYRWFMPLLCLLFITQVGAQITYSEDFEASIGGWTSTGAFWSRTTTSPCTGAGSARANMYDFATATTFRSPLLGVSNGGDITLS